MNVLWLASWYPNRTNTTTGDFIERHAQAVAPFVDALNLIAVVKDDTMAFNEVHWVEEQHQNIRSIIVYYGKSKWGKWIDQMLSFYRYMALQRKAYAKIYGKSAHPNLVHVHVAMKAGLFAVELKKKYQIPFVVTEHWSGYYSASKPNIQDMGKVFLGLTKKVLNNAAIFLPVSKDLGSTVSKTIAHVDFKPISNVVNTTFFFPVDKPTTKFTFIHASYLNYQKNPEGIIQACKILKDKGYDFKVQFIGAKPAYCIELVQALEVSEIVQFHDAVPYQDVAKYMQGADALLMFSRFENQPCIILEALCCGLPVISTNVGGILEVINDSNGILITNENIHSLVHAMESMLKGERTFNKKEIAKEAASKYAYGIIGQIIVNTYASIAFEN